MSLAVITTGILVRRGSGTAGTAKTLTTSTVANPTVLSAVAHGFVSGQSVTVAGHTGSTPALSGPYVVTVLTPNTFSIPVNVTVGGTGGTATAAEVFADIAEVVNVTPPGFSRNPLDTTTHNDGVESKVLGMLRQKDPSFRINYIGTDASHKNVIADLMGNIKSNWMFSFPSGVTFIGPGRVSMFEIVDAATDAIQQANIGIVWSGPITMIAA